MRYPLTMVQRHARKTQFQHWSLVFVVLIDVELLGYDIDLTPRQPGDVIDITTFWRAWRTMDRRYISSINLLDSAVTMWGQSDNTLGGTYPHILWAPGEYVNEPLDLTLYWQAIDQPTADHTVFTQLIGPDGQVWGQQDNQPQQGRYPTTYWELQDPVLDRYSLTLREGAPPGQYQLLVGMYDLQTGQRLHVVDAEGNRLHNDAIPLATLLFQGYP